MNPTLRAEDPAQLALTWGASASLGHRPADLIASTSATGTLPRPILGAFSVAGYPDLPTSVDCLAAYAQNGASLLEVGVPTADPQLDGPDITAAHRSAMRAGDGIRTTLEAVRRLATQTETPIVVMSYWATARNHGLRRMADALASNGATGCLIPDVPPAHGNEWVAAAADAGISSPLLADRNVTPNELEAVCRAATGFLYVPAITGQRTGYSAGLDLDALATSVRSAKRMAPTTPVLTGIGVSTPEEALAVVSRTAVDGIVVGSPLIRALTDGGLPRATALVREFTASTLQPRGL